MQNPTLADTLISISTHGSQAAATRLENAIHAAKLARILGCSRQIAKTQLTQHGEPLITAIDAGDTEAVETICKGAVFA